MSRNSKSQQLCLTSFLLPEIFQFNVFFKNISNNIGVSDLDSKSDLLWSICLNNCIKPCKPDSCSHNFCKICLNKWKKYKKICPKIINIY